jgi:hypothetical protein
MYGNLFESLKEDKKLRKVKLLNPEAEVSSQLFRIN